MSDCANKVSQSETVRTCLTLAQKEGNILPPRMYMSSIRQVALTVCNAITYHHSVHHIAGKF